MKIRHFAIASAGMLLLAGLAVACGGGTSGYGGGNSPTSAPATPPAAAAVAPTMPETTPAAGGAVATPATSPGAGTAMLSVTAMDYSFSPTGLKAAKGQAIEVNVNNMGSATHTFTVYSDANYTTKVADTGSIAGGSSATLMIPPATGDLYYRCQIHPTQMSGEISVD